MASTGAWVRQHRDLFQPQAAHAIMAMRHIGKSESRRLFSPDQAVMRSTEGRWFELIVYEMLLSASRKTDHISRVVYKAKDAPSERVPVKLGQNGLFYSRSGDITIRGNGQDLAEFDILFIDGDGLVGFGEAITSPADLKEFEVEITYKKTLLAYLFKQPVTPFILASTFDIRTSSIGKRILADPDNAFILSPPCEDLKAFIRGRTMIHHTRGMIPNPKGIIANGIGLKCPFDYRRYHDTERDRVFSWIEGRARKQSALQPQEGTGRLVKKILYGSLYPAAIKHICQQRRFTIRGEQIDYPALHQQFSKAILATDLPDFSLIIYLRSRDRREYYKMVQDRYGNFKFERTTPPKVGFFLWLEVLPPTLGAKVACDILDVFTRTPKK